MLSNTLSWTFAIWNLFTYFIHVISKNNRTYSKKQAEEQVFLYSWDYTINHNENEEEK